MDGPTAAVFVVVRVGSDDEEAENEDVDSEDSDVEDVNADAENEDREEEEESAEEVTLLGNLPPNGLYGAKSLITIKFSSSS